MILNRSFGEQIIQQTAEEYTHTNLGYSLVEVSPVTKKENDWNYLKLLVKDFVDMMSITI